MKQMKIGGRMLIMLVLLVACGETPVEETPEQNTLQEPTNSDSLLTIESDLTGTAEMTAEAEISDKEELLAENLNESDNSESSHYIKTEMHDVVLSRKTPGSDNPGNGSDESSSSDLILKIISSPEIINPTTEAGIVSVQVKINSDGKVTETKLLPVSHKTNTTNLKLHEAALKYAELYKFESVKSVENYTIQVLDIEFTTE